MLVSQKETAFIKSESPPALYRFLIWGFCFQRMKSVHWILSLCRVWVDPPQEKQEWQYTVITSQLSEGQTSALPVPLSPSISRLQLFFLRASCASNEDPNEDLPQEVSSRWPVVGYGYSDLVGQSCYWWLPPNPSGFSATALGKPETFIDHSPSFKKECANKRIP